ncbi:hypothetical protein BN8_03086 [Fibrisoma limi BUZ 3]|uniref:Uncharacterized protein n=1 Tax=Fibrisoma limi BUZ 3 TaxID=1185876 RepID=I2GJ75_9BACT|nr:hypothetical protein [Fibrisoma limi]CCH53950.1 hypothetical protein BN8_03086 [Fibrisoma limi BUZ 3]
MKSSRELTCLGARIKLLKRQLTEWNELLVQQREVRRLIHKQVDSQTPVHFDTMTDKLAYMTSHAVRLVELGVRQADARQQMKARHQQEETDLEQQINML